MGVLCAAAFEGCDIPHSPPPQLRESHAGSMSSSIAVHSLVVNLGAEAPYRYTNKVARTCSLPHFTRGIVDLLPHVYTGA